jgi:hypothetical protein
MDRGRTSLVKFKFQRSYCSSDMSGQGPNMSEKSLWKPVKESDKYGVPDLIWNRSNRYVRFQHTLEFGFLSPLLKSL